MTFQHVPGIIARFAVEQDLQPVGLHCAAVKIQTRIAVFPLPGQRFNPALDAADFRVIV